MKAILACSCFFALLGCAPQGKPAAEANAESFTFACANGKTFSVTYDEGFTVATVKADGQTYKLPAIIAASGSRYSDGKIEYWEHHGEALLHGTPAGELNGCPQKTAE
ncbi:MAG: MliC family protein [Hyphomonadaceae bacterium]|nr:MliC family protein [Hyphomonadaceae bacterium]